MAMQQQMSPQAQMGLAAGPDSAAAGALPPELIAALQAQQAQPQPVMNEADQMRQMLQAGMGGQ